MSSLLIAPCLWCDYNGPNYWGEFTHSKECPWYKIGSEIGRQAKLRDIVMADLTAKKDLKTIYNSLMIKEGFPINRVVDYIKKLHDLVPVGRSFQERVAWFLGAPLNSSEDELARILGERLKNVNNTEEMWKEYLVEAPPPKKQKDILESVPVCGLCGNMGIVETTAKTGYGAPCGVRKPCICPNGRLLKKRDHK